MSLGAGRGGEGSSQTAGLWWEQASRVSATCGYLEKGPEQRTRSTIPSRSSGETRAPLLHCFLSLKPR